MSVAGRAIFLSYASQDAEPARRICEALRAAGLEIWFDQSALRGGDAWDASIRRQIKECALFMPVISANTQAREEGYFRREWNLAVNRTLDMADDRTFLLPVVIDATLDANARVPERFREVQWTHLPGGDVPGTFAERVQRLLGGGSARASPIGLPPRTAVIDAPAARQDAPSIAVLPFVNMSRDEENEYFADGLAEELLNVLAKIRGLRVAARSSAFKFRGKAVDAAEVGHALNVATVLEGSVRRAGNRLRIAVRLVKVAGGYQLWSETYDRTMDDIFAVQDDIAQSVVKELRTTLFGDATGAAAEPEAVKAVADAVKGRSSNPEAHGHFLLARHLIDRYTREETARAIGYLKQALALEPGFALALAELGRAYANEANLGWAPAAEGFERAREATARALALEPDLAEAHAGMAWIRMAYDWDWHAADESFRRALELAPGNALVLHQAGILAANTGRFEDGIALGRRAVEQDPLSSAAYYFLGLTFHRSPAIRRGRGHYPEGARTGTAKRGHARVARDCADAATTPGRGAGRSAARAGGLGALVRAGGLRARSGTNGRRKRRVASVSRRTCRRCRLSDCGGPCRARRGGCRIRLARARPRSARRRRRVDESRSAASRSARRCTLDRIPAKDEIRRMKQAR